MQVISALVTADAQAPIPVQNDQADVTLDFDRQLRVSIGPRSGSGKTPKTTRAIAASTSVLAAGAGKTMSSFNACEVVGGAAEFRLYLGSAATADGDHELAHVKLAAGESAPFVLSIDASTGIYCERVAGTFDLTIIP
jgi:hypothetical protein